ncbi:unnamed protein product, partial [Rhizoctonia solani]
MISKGFINIANMIFDFQRIYGGKVQMGISDKLRYLKTQIGTLVRRIDEHEVQAELSQAKGDLNKTLMDLKKLEDDASSLREVFS